MDRLHVVVDGSNIATEGRTAPSLGQLDEAVRSFIAQYGYEKVTVIVDATFGHRIDASETVAFEAAILNGELITPPAGTIGRGDAFILQVARLADADVLSNDSFQELHAEHTWLFEPGRLWGGKPVPAVGWVFVPRAPVRGITSRRAVQAAKRATKAADTAKKKPAPPKAAAEKAREAPVAAVAASVDPSAAPASTRRRRRRGAGTGPASTSTREPANTQLAYAAFVVEHPIGSVVLGTVERFSSHGAYVRVNGAAGYVPLRSLGDPPPRSARSVLALGEERTFVVTRFDPINRGIDVVPADLDATPTSVPKGAKAAAAAAAVESSETDAEEAPVSPAARKATKKKATARKATAKKRSTAKRAPARKTAAKKAAKRTTAKRAPARKKATAKRAPAKKKSTAKRAPAKKKATARKATAKRTTKKATAKRAAKKR